MHLPSPPEATPIITTQEDDQETTTPLPTTQQEDQETTRPTIQEQQPTIGVEHPATESKDAILPFAPDARDLLIYDVCRRFMKESSMWRNKYLNLLNKRRWARLRR